MLGRFAEEVHASGARNEIKRLWQDVCDNICNSKNKLSFYEILEGPVRAVYLDIEWQGRPNKTLVGHVTAAAERALTRLKERKVSRVFTFDASGDGKASYHVHLMIDGPPFAGPEAVGTFVREHVAPSFPDIVDVSPYARRQCWRLPGAVKKSAPLRPLLPADGSALTPAIIFESRVQCSAARVPRAPVGTSLPCAALEFARKRLGASCVVEHLIHLRGDTWVIPSTRHYCEIAQRAHRSNHVYMVMDRRLLVASVRCHAAACVKRACVTEFLPSDVRAAFMAEWGCSLSDEQAPKWLRNLTVWRNPHIKANAAAT